MMRRLDRSIRSLPILALAAATALLSAQTLPTTRPADDTAPSPVPTGSTVSATQPATAPTTAPSGVLPTTRTDIRLPEPTSRPAKLIKLEFKDAPLSQVIDYLSESLGFTVKKTAPIEGRINLVTRTPVTPEVALTVLDEALADNNLTAVQEGTILKIVPISGVKKLTPVRVGENPEEIAATAEWITQIIPVKNVDAVKLRTDIQPLVDSDADFTANQGSNTLILTDTSANVKRVVTIVAELDKSTAQSSQVKIYHLKSANATATSKLLISIFAPDQAQNGQGGPGGGGGGPGRMFRQMMMGGAGGPGGGAAGADSGKATGKVTAAADDRTNTIVVVAPSDTLKLIDTILAELDSDPTEAAVIQPFQLKFADPSSAAKLINNVFQPSPQANQGGFPFGGFGGQRIQNFTDTDPNARVTAAAADKSNTLVVTAPPHIMKVIDGILKQLDSDPAAMSQVSVFQLKFADSDSAAKLVNTIFSANQAQQQQPQIQNPFRFGGPQLQGVESTTGARTGSVNAVSDARTNTVVVTAPGDLMRVVSGILEKLDSNPSAESALFIYHLRNGVAADIQSTMSSLFSTASTGANNNSNNNRNSGQSLNSSGLGGNSGFGANGGRNGGGIGGGGGGGGIGGGNNGNFGQPLTSNSSSLANRPTGASGNGANAGASVRATSELVGQVIVVADNDTNSLLVSTASKYKEQVMKIIEELDRPVPQVLIKVLVAEVTHERTNDLGPDFSVLNTRPSGKGLTATQTLGNVGSFASNGGLVVSLMEDNLNATLHLLATEGKLDVLSRPYILASDNQAAAITVGQEVPFITATQITNTGQQINTITYQAVGIILNVTPHINPDGKVTLDVSPEISAISATTVPIGNGINAPVIDNRSAQSRVTIANGNTIVIGGMMQDQKTTTVSKVPLLGDIPFIGQAFSRHQDDRSKTELLIFLTPHVAAQPDTLKGMSEDEVNGTKLTPNAVDKGVYLEHRDGLNRGATQRESTSRQSVIEFRPTPSTQPFHGINISGSPSTEPAPNPTPQEPGK